jgi:alpha-tubulin suppressor-like RCC1 family protein
LYTLSKAQTTPTTLPSAGPVIAISANGDGNIMALLRNGTVAAWGFAATYHGPIPDGLSNVTAIASGPFFSFAIKDKGVVAWGADFYSVVSGIPRSNDVVAIAAGDEHGLALHENGTISTWGVNNQGQLTIPPGLCLGAGIACGRYHNLVLCRDGTVAAFGSSPSSEITNVPADLPGLIGSRQQRIVRFSRIKYLDRAIGRNFSLGRLRRRRRGWRTLGC